MNHTILHDDGILWSTLSVPPPAVGVFSSHVPYDGTAFNLTGYITLDPAVDVPITATGVWMDGNGMVIHMNAITAPPL